MFPVKSLLTYRFPNFENLAEVRCPTTIFHGDEDYVVPYRSGEKLSKIDSQSEIKLITVEGGGHNDLVGFEAYQKGIQQTLE